MQAKRSRRGGLLAIAKYKTQAFAFKPYKNLRFLCLKSQITIIFSRTIN